MEILASKSDSIISKKIFALSILSIVLAGALSTHAQFSVDSLKKICVTRYNKQFIRRGGDMQLSADSSDVCANELYKDAFARVKIFSVTKCNCDDCPVSNYVMDTCTGEQPDLSNIETFNKEMNRSPIGLTNYDKACFYLDFGNLSRNTTPSHLYYNYIAKGSIYRGLSVQGLIGYGGLWVDWRKYLEYINRSGKQKIYVGAVTYDPVKGKKVMMYQFSFDKHGQLIGIKRSDLD